MNFEFNSIYNSNSLKTMQIYAEIRRKTRKQKG